MPASQVQTKLAMVTTSAPNTGTAPLTHDQFNAFVQNTYGRYPLTIVRGDGCKLFDSDGKVNTEEKNLNSSKSCEHPQLTTSRTGKHMYTVDAQSSVKGVASSNNCSCP